MCAKRASDLLWVMVLVLVVGGGSALADVFTNVGIPGLETGNLSLVYEFDIPVSSLGWNSVAVPYTVNNAASITTGSFSRVAYYLELVKADTTSDWVYVSFNATGFTLDASKTGVPTTGSGEYYNFQNTTISNMNVYSNVAGIVTGTGIATGNVEFWPSNYGASNDYGTPGASASTYDFGDGGSSTSAGHATMQVHNYGAKQTLFAYNAWGSARTSELGIGNQPSGNPDWTFNTSNISNYATRTLQVLVQLASDLTWNGTDNDWDSANWLGSPPDYPNAGCNATIGAGTVTVEGNQAALGLTMTGGTLAVGAGNTLTVGGPMDAAAGAISLGAGATLKVGSGTATGIAAAHGAAIEASGTIEASHLALASGATFTKTGSGTLSFSQSAGDNTIDGTNTLQVSAGELRVQDVGTGIGGAALALNGGTFSVKGVVDYQAGLLAGSHSGSNWTSGENPGNLGVASSVQGMYTNAGPNDALREAHWGAARADVATTGPDNTTLIYTGQINLAALGDANGAVTFVEQNDDYTRLYLDGQQILYDSSWNNAVSVQYAPADGAGWCDFEIRVGNGGGGYGFSGQQNTSLGDSNWNRATSDPLAIAGGFGVAAGAVTGENADDYAFPVDPGDGSVFRHAADIAAIDMTATAVTVTASSALTATTYHAAAFGALSLQGGSLTTAGSATEISFAGTTIAGGSVGFDTDVKTSPGAIDGGNLGAVITKTGTADLVLDEPGVNLAGAAFRVQEGRLVAMHASNPLGAATLQINGGEALLSSPGGNATYDNAVLATSMGTLSAGQAAGGSAGPVTITVGSVGNGVTINSGSTLALQATDGYSLDVAGQINGGNLRVKAGNITLSGGGTVTRLIVPAGMAGSAGTTGLNVTGRLTLGSLMLDASGAALRVAGNDLLGGERNLTLAGGTISMQDNNGGYLLNQIQGSIFRNTGTSETPVNLDGGIYEYSATRVFTGDKTGTILALAEDSARNAIITTQIYGANDNSTGWTAMFPGYTTGNNFVTAFSGVFIPTTTGSYRFRGSSDDRSLMYVDVDGDGVFDTSDRVSPWAGDTSGYKTLEAGVGYYFMIMSQEFSGNETTNWYVTAPSGSEMRIDPSSASQAGWWASGPIPGTINEPDTHFTVANDSTLQLNTPDTATLGNLTLGGANLSIAGSATTASFARIGGTGTVMTTPEMVVRETISPGNSAGLLAVEGNLAVDAGTTFRFEINSATGTAGTNWDLLDVNGTLDITALSPAEPMTIELISLAGDAPGLLANFACTEPYEWEFLTFDALEGTFSEDLFDLDPVSFANPLGRGYFELIRTAGGLAISYVPEPGTLALAILGALLLLVRRRRT